jgi:hypothetical protein
MKKLTVLTLILLGNVTLIHSQVNCDSSISVCPKVFDYLIKQDVYAKQYKDENLILKYKIIKHEQENSEYNVIIKAKNDIIIADSMEVAIKDEHISDLNLIVKFNKNKIKRLKVGVFSISAVGLASTIFVSTRRR